MTSGGGAGLERFRPGSVVSPFGLRWPVCLCLCLCLVVSLAAAQVNVQFDGEMLAEESARVSQKSWLPWSRTPSSRTRPEGGSSRPVFLSEPWQEETWLPPPPVLSHLADPRSGRLPSLHFPAPPREQQQYQWYPRPPPGAQPSPTAQLPSRTTGGDRSEGWGEANTAPLESSEADVRAQDDNPNGEDLTVSERQHVLHGRRQPAKPRRDYQSGPPVRSSARLQEPAVTADRREFVEPSGNQLTEPRRRHTQATRRRFETSVGDQETAARQRHRAASRAPAAAGDDSGRPFSGPEPRRVPANDVTSSPEPRRVPANDVTSSRRRPWRPESTLRPAEENVTRVPDLGSASAGRGGAAGTDRREGGLERQRPAGRRTAGSVRRGRPVPPSPSLDYARLALGAVAANEAAASLEATAVQHSTDRPASRYSTQRGGDTAAAADYGWRRNTETTSVVDAHAQQDSHQQTRTENGWTDEETEPGTSLSFSTEELSGTAGTDQVYSDNESEQLTELNPFTDVHTESDSAVYSANVAAELAALSALLSSPRDAADGGFISAPSHGYKANHRYNPTVTRASLSSKDVIRVPIGWPLRGDTSTASGSDDTSTTSDSDDTGSSSASDDIGTVPVSDDTSTDSDNDDTSTVSAGIVTNKPTEATVALDISPELSVTGPAHTAEHAVPESMPADGTEYDYSYDYDEYYDEDEYYNQDVEGDVDSDVALTEAGTSSVATEPPSTEAPPVLEVQRSVNTARLGQPGHRAAIIWPGVTAETTERLSSSVPQEAASEGQKTRANVKQDEEYLSSTHGKEDQEYSERNESISPETDHAESAMTDIETEEARLSDKADIWDSTTASYSDVINNVLGEVFQDMFRGTGTTSQPQVIPAAGEVVNDIEYPEYDTELYDDVAETLTIAEPTSSAFESTYESESSPTSTEATEEAIDSWYEDEGSLPMTTTRATTDVTFEHIYSEEMGMPDTTEAPESATLKAEPSELQVQHRSTTARPLSSQTVPTAATTSANPYFEETSTGTYQPSTTADSDLVTEAVVASITAVGAESVTDTSDLMITRTAVLPAQISADDVVGPTVTPEISTLSPRTRLYLFSNFPEFTGSEQRSLESVTENPDDERTTEPVTEFLSTTTATEQTERSGPVTTTTRPSSVSDSDSTAITTEPAVATTASAEPRTTLLSHTRTHAASYRNVIATRTTTEPDFDLADETSSKYSTPYEFSTAVTESTATTTEAKEPSTRAPTEETPQSTGAPAEATPQSTGAPSEVTTRTMNAAADLPGVTRRTIPSLQSRPTFSKFYRFGKGAPVAVTQPTTTERSSTQVSSEPTISHITARYSSTQHIPGPTSSPTEPSTVKSSSPPLVTSLVSSSSSSPPPVSSPALTTSVTTEETVTTKRPSKPSLNEVRSAIQPFSLAEMLVESGQSLASFLRSDYTMSDVLAIIERLRARREGRPVAAPERPRVTTEAMERTAGTVSTPDNTGDEAGRITATRPSSAEFEVRLLGGSGGQQNPPKDDVLPSGRRVLPATSLDENQSDSAQRFIGVPTETSSSSSAAPPVRRRKQWSLAEILDEKQLSLPAFLAQGGDIKQLLLEYNGVTLSAGGSDVPAPQPATTPPPSSAATTRVYSLAEILSLRQQTLKQFISGGGSVRDILEEYNGVGWRAPQRTTTAVPSSSSGLPAFLTRFTAAPASAAGTETAAAEEEEALRPLLGEGGRYVAADGGEKRGTQPGIRLMTPAPPIYGRPAPPMLPPPLDNPLLLALPPPPPAGFDATRTALPPVLPPDELFERINQETEAVWAAAGGVGGGGGGGDGDQHHQVDSTVFDIELSSSASAVSPAVWHAVIASGVVGGCALLFFVALLLFCKWRQRHEQQALRPGLAVGSERSSSPLDPSRINVNNYANAYRHKTTGFWGSLRKSFNQRYAAAYSDSPYGGVST